MLKFIFILTLWHPNAPADVYVMDSGLTGQDCIARVTTYAETFPDYAFGEPSCEIDQGEK